MKDSILQQKVLQNKEFWVEVTLYHAACDSIVDFLIYIYIRYPKIRNGHGLYYIERIKTVAG